MKDNEAPGAGNSGGGQRKERRDGGSAKPSKQAAPAPLNDFQAKLAELKKKFN